MGETLEQTLEVKTTNESNVIHIASVAVKKAAAALNYKASSDFGPYGIGRLPNDLNGYPDPFKALESHVDYSVYTEDTLPAYIVASRVSVQEIAC